MVEKYPPKKLVFVKPFVLVLTLQCFLYAFHCKGQQRPQYTQYINNQFLLNPAVAGTAEAPEVRGGFRVQWAGITDAPRSIYATAHMPLGLLPSSVRGKTKFGKNFYHGIGLLAQSDVTGPTSRTSIYAAYAYNQALTQNLRAAIGFFGGVQQFALDDSKLKFADPGAAKISSFSKVFADGGVGGWLYTNKAWMGASILQVLRNQFSTYDYTKGIYVAHRHFFVTGGYNFRLDKDWTLTPSILLKWVNPVPLSVDFNAKLRYKNSFFAGLSYRTSDAVSLMAGLVLNNSFDFGYAYDATFSNLGRNSAGSHELFLGYRFIRKSKRVYNPSDFWR